MNDRPRSSVFSLSTGISPYGLLIILCLVIANAQAMWVGLSQAELVEKSVLIVKATYLGESSVALSSSADAKSVTFGVLQVSEVLKGGSVGIVLLRVPDPKALIRRSDEIFFKHGQTGLWFLRRDDEYKGIFLADHPHRFSSVKNTEEIKKIINK